MLWTEVRGQPRPLATYPEPAAPTLGGARRAAVGVGMCGGHGAIALRLRVWGLSGRAAAPGAGMGP